MERTRPVGAAHLFVDESKSMGFTLAVAMFDERRLADARKGLRSMLLPGQRRLHFTRESPARRRAILAALSRLGMSAVPVTTRSDETGGVLIADGRHRGMRSGQRAKTIR